MKATFNYFYDGRPITKKRFLLAVPEHWEDDAVNGDYSWGYYRATAVS